MRKQTKHNIELIDELLAKAAPRKSGSGVTCTGLTHREAAVLLACDHSGKKLSRCTSLQTK